ncbi:metal-dependent transcriptional regulator [Natranaerofaba carboxydovora]|uniref:metal-dependent transcriptional regulator n=1 Tax=Natranaerofaba carboxydovora TaxID=2742683 RepID=UPI001F13EB6D|nr:iron dependent repressor, metal binding and dimerization domain protein [Natranaerofaba carboxydovora]UMZ74260.1 Transcriptional regulator MntR [Natranaerofaba carboxydovora]
MSEYNEFFTDRGYESLKGKDSLSPSMEDYLEMVFRLSKEDGFTRVNIVADNLNVKPSSVTRMMQRLYEKDLLNYEKYGIIELTEKGKALGEYLLKRHSELEKLLETLGANNDLQRQVERIEHHIDPDNFEVLSLFLKFLEDNHDVLERFERYKKNKGND